MRGGAGSAWLKTLTHSAGGGRAQVKGREEPLGCTGDLGDILQGPREEEQFEDALQSEWREKLCGPIRLDPFTCPAPRR